tara:strand:- start:160 stop:369 length:210 start_codon:yes stop_codon:yes gene_type:complete
MVTDLWKLNKICEKHGISGKDVQFILNVLEQGALNSNVLNEFGYKINPKLQNILDDFVEAGFISLEVEE